MIDLDRARRELREEGLDGWLLYDFQGLNPIARQAAGLPPDRFLTRRWFCLVPREGEPRWLVHAIERAQFEGVPGAVATYARRTELESGLRALLGSERRVAVEYSPGANVPYISRIDAGTMELIRAAGAEVRSSGDLVQALLARWPPRGKALHDEAARVLERAASLAFDTIGDMLRSGRLRRPSEALIQKEIVVALEAHDLASNAPPIVAVNAHTADPHYAPGDAPGHDAEIGEGDLVLIDLWAKRKGDPEAIYADITLMGFVGEAVPDRVQEVFRTVAAARDAALEAARAAWREGREIRGFEVDRAARDVVEGAGYGDFFTHRTGHSLGIEDHWIGANMDDFETRDERRLLPGTGFTIEPGIYLPGELGVRSEIDVYYDPVHGPLATTLVQEDLVKIRAR